MFGDTGLLEQTLRYHLTDGAVSIADIRGQGADVIASGHPALAGTPTWQGRPVTVAVWQELAKVNNAAIIEEDVATANGLVQVVDLVLTPVSLSAPESPPEGFNDETMAWEPYPPGELLPIGDAELVPGHPAVLDGVNQFSELLKRDDVKINVARAVRLEDQGEITYLAPLAAQSVPPTFNDLVRLAEGQGFDHEIMTIEGKTELFGGPGSYLRRVLTDNPDSGEWYIEFKAPNNETVGYAALTFPHEETASFAVPEAALFYGTAFCRDYTRYGYTCHRCRIYELRETHYPTDQCRR